MLLNLLNEAIKAIIVGKFIVRFRENHFLLVFVNLSNSKTNEKITGAKRDRVGVISYKIEEVISRLRFVGALNLGSEIFHDFRLLVCNSDIHC